MFPCQPGGTIRTGIVSSYEASFFWAFSGTGIFGIELLFFVISRSPVRIRRVALRLLRCISNRKKKNRPMHQDGLLQFLGDLFSKHSSCTSSGYRALGTVASPARLPDPLRITPNAPTML